MHVVLAFAGKKRCEYVYNAYDAIPQSTFGELSLFDSTKIYIYSVQVTVIRHFFEKLYNII
jgi:hypothetical protein